MEQLDQFFLKSITYTNIKVDCKSNDLVAHFEQSIFESNDELKNEVVDVLKPIKKGVDKHELQIPEIRACQLQNENMITEHEDRITEHEDRITKLERRCNEQEQDLMLNEKDIADIRSMIFCQNKEDSSRLAS